MIVVELMLLCYHSLNFVVTCFIFKKQKSIRHHNLFLLLYLCQNYCFASLTNCYLVLCDVNPVLTLPQFEANFQFLDRFLVPAMLMSPGS